MKFSKEKLDEIKSKVRLELAKNPNASCRDIALSIGHNHKFINWIKNEVHRDIEKNISKVSLKKEIVDFQVLVQESSRFLWDIVTSQSSSNLEKISAVKSLTNSHALLLDKKIESGFLIKEVKEEETEQINFVLIESKEQLERFNKMKELEKRLDEKIKMNKISEKED